MANLKKRIQWLLNIQRWYFEVAVKKSPLPFGQPDITFTKCKKWYQGAQEWAAQSQQPPPPPPPK